MTHPVFISYARDASREPALALHQALGGRTAFLDTEAISLGERFPEALADALFNARVVVIFAEPAYFTRWYCLLEFRIARTPFLRVAERQGATAQEKEEALRGLVVAMPPRGVNPMMDRFPPLVAARSWPDVGDVDRIAELVLGELATNPPTLRERYAADADRARSFLLDATRLPPPMRIGSLPFVPQVGLPNSIADAFVGRADDLWRIHDLLWTERGDPATAAGLTGSIEAIGGFGKTRLALEYLYRFGPRHFKGGLFWINAESDPELQLYDVLQALDPQAPAIEQIRQVPGGVPAALARTIRARSDDVPTPLFIIDNVPEPEAGQQPKSLDTWCPVLGEVPVLTTSRTRVALGAGGSVVALPIEALDPDAAVALLTTEVRRDQLEDAEWNRIAEWAGHLPLALEVLNRLLRSGEMAPRALLALSREQRPSAAVDAAMESIRHVVPAGALRGITEAFSASYNLLTPEEQYAARLIAWIASAAIPTFVIDEFGSDVFALGVRGKLRNRSFVTEVRNSSEASYGMMHRVLADFIRARSQAPEYEAEVVSSALTRLMESAEGKGAEGSTLVRECASLASSVFGNWIAGLPAENRFSGPWEFAIGAGDTLLQWGHPTLAGDLFELLVSACSRRFGDEHPDTLSAMNNLAVTRRDRGDYAGGQKLQERVLEGRRRVLGEEHAHTLTSMNNLALTRSDLGDFTGAQELQQKVMESRRRVLGNEHRETLGAMSNLANTLAHQGDYAGAQELQEQVKEGMGRILGHDHPDTLTAMHNLALTRIDRGDYAGVHDLSSVVKARLSIMGEEHPDTLSAMNNLAGAYSALGDHPAAHDIQERVVEVRRRVLGDEHPDTLISITNLASMHRVRGDHGKAEELQERVLEGMQRILGDEHPVTLSTMNNLANTRRERGDVARALDLEERVVDARLRIFGIEHPDTLTSMNNMAITLCMQGDFVRAQVLQIRALEVLRRRLGVEHPSTTVASWGLLQMYIATKNFDSADSLVRVNLLWLLNRKPVLLSEQQRQIQANLRAMVQRGPDESANRE